MSQAYFNYGQYFYVHATVAALLYDEAIEG